MYDGYTTASHTTRQDTREEGMNERSNSLYCVVFVCYLLIISPADVSNLVYLFCPLFPLLFQSLLNQTDNKILGDGDTMNTNIYKETRAQKDSKEDRMQDGDEQIGR
jgi:hypothetical protein